jgi:hypothetical protein
MKATVLKTEVRPNRRNTFCFVGSYHSCRSHIFTTPVKMRVCVCVCVCECALFQPTFTWLLYDTPCTQNCLF